MHRRATSKIMTFTALALLLLAVTITHFSIDITAGVKFFKRELPKQSEIKKLLQPHIDDLEQECERLKNEVPRDPILRVLKEICKDGLVDKLNKKIDANFDNIWESFQDNDMWKTVQKACSAGRATIKAVESVLLVFAVLTAVCVFIGVFTQSTGCLAFPVFAPIFTGILKFLWAFTHVALAIVTNHVLKPELNEKINELRSLEPLLKFGRHLARQANLAQGLTADKLPPKLEEIITKAISDIMDLVMKTTLHLPIWMFVTVAVFVIVGVVLDLVISGFAKRWRAAGPSGGDAEDGEHFTSGGQVQV